MNQPVGHNPSSPPDFSSAKKGDGDHVDPFPTLRIWPAVALVVAIWSAKLIPGLFSEVSMALFMISAFVPALLTVGILIWWCFFSRAPRSEKLWGIVGILVIAVASHLTAHFTVKGYGTVMNIVPWGGTAFAVAMILLARMNTRRVWLALFATLVAVGFWSTVRVDGIWGDFRSTRNWRWTPTAEALYLESLAAGSKAASSDRVDLAATADEMESPTKAEWPSFRGPQRSGQVPGVILETDLDAHPPREIWRIRVGPGWSSFAIAGRRLFTQEQRADDEAVVCWDTETGTELWAHLYESRFYEVVGGAGPRATPTWDDGRLFCLGANGILTRLDSLTGQAVWSADLQEDAKREPPEWGFSSSPLVLNDLVIVHGGGEGDKGILAYDVETGQLRWGAPAGDHSYSSPHPAMIDGQQVVLMLTNDGLSAVDAASGELQFDYPWEFQGYRVLQPLLLSSTEMLLGTGMGTGTRRIDIQHDESGWQTDEVWTSQGIKPDFNDYVVQGGYLFGFDHNIFACLDVATGERTWKKGRYGNGQVLSLPNGKQLLVLSETGEVVILRANGEAHEELAKFAALSGKTWNHPVLIGNRLFVRNGEEAACYELATVAGADGG